MGSSTDISSKHNFQSGAGGRSANLALTMDRYLDPLFAHTVQAFPTNMSFQALDISEVMYGNIKE